MPSTSTATDPLIPAREVALAGDDPVTVTATVVSVERRDEPGIFDRMIGLDAILHIQFHGDSHLDSVMLSRLVEEPYWLQDAHFGPNGFPDFAHGFGSRCVKKHGIPPELESLLDEAARTRGLAAEIGPDIPLTLADVPADAGSDA
jgi:hypothetical protein